MNKQKLQLNSPNIRIVRFHPLPLLGATDWTAEITYQVTDSLTVELLDQASGETRYFKSLDTAYHFMRRNGVTAPILII